MSDAAERSALQEAARAAIAGVRDPHVVDEALRRIGWLELLAAAPSDAIEVVFGVLGATNAAASALDDVLLSALGVEPPADLAVVLPAFASWAPPGRLAARRLEAQGLATARAAGARALLVVCGQASSQLSTVIVPAERAQRRAVRGIDPGAGLHEVRVAGDAPAAEPLLREAWEAALALGRRALAHEIAGASRAMLELACAHARERVQFGRPIAGFQAVRHRLADALVAVEALDAALAAARDAPSPESAAAAKAVAGRSARTVGAHAQQVLAGIGFTTEHPFHRFLKRTIALEGLLGSADAITLDLGRRLLATRRVPVLIEL